ncbi:MAG: hypothetical protein JST29_11395 [Bacteroidetes bacterium]|nr:hypothetical protein [Bacteroidota bacterium]
MKKTFTLLTLIAFTLLSSAQQKSNIKSNLITPDTKAKYSGNWKKFISDNIDKSLLENKQLKNKKLIGVYAEKRLDFAVDSNGYISNIKAFSHSKEGWVSSLEKDSLSLEAIKLLQKSQPWIPAKFNNRNINSETSTTIIFKAWFK